MSIDQKLESYLARIDRALGKIPVSDRSDIITELKSHVLEAKDRNPGQDINDVLASLGEPESVANRYLMERGLKPGKRPVTPVIKWLTVGFLGTLSLFLLFVGFILLKFTPLIKVDRDQKQVEILGGAISIHGDDFEFEFSSDDRGERKFEGRQKLGLSKLIRIPFANGKLEVSTSDSDDVTWNCKTTSKKGEPKISGGHQTLLSLEEMKGVTCDIAIPSGAQAEFNGANGKIAFVRPHFNLDADLGNGVVSIEPDPARHYRYDTRISNGSIDQFNSSSATDALKVKIVIANGKVSKR